MMAALSWSKIASAKPAQPDFSLFNPEPFSFQFSRRNYSMFAVLKKAIPREDKFHDMFEAHAACSIRAATHLKSVFQGQSDIAAGLRSIEIEEEAADLVTDQVMEAVRKSFITPFDRSDIQNLITAMDDAIDQMNKAGKAVRLFRVTTFEPQMVSLALDALRMAELLTEAVPLMRNMGTNANQLHNILAEIVQIEKETDRSMEEGLKVLLDGKATRDPMAYFINAEIYGHLEKIADRFEDAAQTMSGIVVEHV
jgi:uncharacterized protein